MGREQRGGSLSRNRDRHRSPRARTTQRSVHPRTPPALLPSASAQGCDPVCGLIVALVKKPKFRSLPICFHLNSPGPLVGLIRREQISAFCISRRDRDNQSFIGQLGSRKINAEHSCHLSFGRHRTLQCTGLGPTIALAWRSTLIKIKMPALTSAISAACRPAPPLRPVPQMPGAHEARHDDPNLCVLLLALPRALSQPELCPQLRAWLPFRVWGHPRKGKGRRAKASRSAPLCFVAGSARARNREKNSDWL